MYGEIHENLWKLFSCIRGAVVIWLINIGWSVIYTSHLTSLLILPGPWNRFREFAIRWIQLCQEQKAPIFYIAVARWSLTASPPQVIGSVAEMSCPHCRLKVIQFGLVHLTLVTVQVGLHFLFAGKEGWHYSFYFVVEDHTKLGYFGALTKTWRMWDGCSSLTSSELTSKRLSDNTGDECILCEWGCISLINIPVRLHTWSG